jgi:hypothetical protein
MSEYVTGFGYNPQLVRSADSDLLKLAGKPVELLVWGERPNQRHVDLGLHLESLGIPVKSVHLPTYSFQKQEYTREVMDDIVFLEGKLPQVESFTIHPPTPKVSKEASMKAFVERVSRVATQTDCYINTENLRGKLLNSYNDVAEFSRLLDKTGLPNLGIVLDTTHIPLTRHRRVNTEAFLTYMDAAGNRLQEVHASEPKFFADAKHAKGHNALTGEFFDWAKIYARMEAERVAPILEVMGLGTIMDSYRFLLHKGIMKNGKTADFYTRSEFEFDPEDPQRHEA